MIKICVVIICLAKKNLKGIFKFKRGTFSMEKLQQHLRLILNILPVVSRNIYFLKIFHKQKYQSDVKITHLGHQNEGKLATGVT